MLKRFALFNSIKGLIKQLTYDSHVLNVCPHTTECMHFT